MKTQPIELSRTCGTAYRDGDYGDRLGRRSRRQQQRRRPKLATENQIRARSINEQGCKIVARLIKRGWDCHQSMPRNNCYLLYCPKFGGYDCVLFYRGRWRLNRKRRGTGR